MAGLALLGNLTPVLDSAEPFEIFHRLESVKLLDRSYSTGGDPEYHGYLTIQAVSRPEITAPQRQRVFGMAVTARDARDRGRPSAWSATIDRLAVDYDNQGETPRLFVISAGNIEDPNAWAEYPASNSTDGIHDPGQAWNALTVGASTELVHITEPDTDGYQPIAPIGGLSPFSATSQTWESHWPLKPDLVFEGGNAAKDSIGAVWMPSLSLLTTNSKINERLFTTTGQLSVSTMHLAKGLEFRVVAVMACDDEVIPLQERIESVAEAADLDEVYDTERYLLYVACTRARDYLLVTSGGPASEFLDDIYRADAHQLETGGHQLYWLFC